MHYAFSKVDFSTERNDMAYYYTNDSAGKRGLNRSNIKREDAPLAVNSAGEISLDRPFATDNVEGRVDFYLMYILEGRLDFIFGEEQRSLSAGSFILFGPNYRYRYSNAGGSSIRYCWCHFSGYEVEKILHGMGFDSFPFVGRLSRPEEILHSFDRINDSITESEPVRTYIIAGIFSSVLASLAKAKSNEEKALPLDRSVAYINLNYSSEITVASLAALENLSPSRYGALFRERFGSSPIEYVISARIRASLSLLSDTDMPINEISRLVGYSDSHFFSRLFKRKMGRSPREYRLRHRSAIISTRE